MIEALDKILEEIGYMMTQVDTSVSTDNFGGQSIVSAIGTQNAIRDRNKILNHLSSNGIQVIKLDISLDRNIVPNMTIGSRGIQHDSLGIEEISLSFDCYSESVPQNAKVLTPYPEPLPDDSPNFELDGAL